MGGRTGRSLDWDWDITDTLGFSFGLFFIYDFLGYISGLDNRLLFWFPTRMLALYLCIFHTSAERHR